jgi:hypothetical protein
VVERRLLLPGKWLAPNAEHSAIVKILIKGVKNSFMMNVSTVPQKVNSLLVPFFSFVVFRKLQFLDADDFILKIYKPVRLKH